MNTDPMDVILDHADQLGAAMALWSTRDDTQAQPEVTQAGQRAYDTIDSLLYELNVLRSRLVTELRQHQDAGNARTDELLERLRAERSGVIPLPDEESDDELLDEWRDPGSGPGE